MNLYLIIINANASTQVEYWIREVTEVVADAEREATQTRSSEHANRVLHKLHSYDQQKEQYGQKLSTAEQQARELHCKKRSVVIWQSVLFSRRD